LVRMLKARSRFARSTSSRLRNTSPACSTSPAPGRAGPAPAASAPGHGRRAPGSDRPWPRGCAPASGSSPPGSGSCAGRHRPRCLRRAGHRGRRAGSCPGVAWPFSVTAVGNAMVSGCWIASGAMAPCVGAIYPGRSMRRLYRPNRGKPAPTSNL
jgi:hypothetical protein